MPTEERHELPAPTRFYQAISSAEVDMEVMEGVDEVRLDARRVPGGRFGFELSASYDYAGMECRQVVDLDREGAEALCRAVASTLGWKVVEDEGVDA